MVLPVKSQEVFAPISGGDGGFGTLRQALLNASIVFEEIEVVIDFSDLQFQALPGQAVVELTSAPLSVLRRMRWTADPTMPKPIIRRIQGKQGLVELVNIANGEVEFTNLRFENGHAASSSGGAISYNQGAGGRYVHLRLSGCEFFGNLAGEDDPLNPSFGADGGAVRFVGNEFEPVVSSLVVESCLFEANQVMATGACNGAALFVDRADFEIRDTVFRGNVVSSDNATAATFGGALAAFGGNTPMIIERCVFESNVSTAVSALHIRRNAALTSLEQDEVRDSTFLNNQGFGAALDWNAIPSNTPGEIRNSTFSGNSGESTSCINLSRVRLEMHHCTISGNIHSSPNGTAVLLPNESQTSLFISRSVVAGNLHADGNQASQRSPDIVAQTITSEGYNFIGSATGFNNVFVGPDDQTGTNASPLKPMLAPVGDFGGPVPTRPPLPESPLVDAMPGAASTFVPFDVLGVARAQGVRGDIGAVELPRLPYSTWQLQIPEVSERGNTSDPDKDGLVNAIEYLLGTNPNSAGDNPIQIVRTATGDFVEVQRSALIRPAFFTVNRFETSEDLDVWLPIDTDPIVTPMENGSINVLKYRYPITIGPGTKRFFRAFVIPGA